MTGSELVRMLTQLLNEDTDSGWLDVETPYDYIYEAVIEFVSRTNCVSGFQDITTIANQADYDLNSDFLKLYLKKPNGTYYIKYSDGSSTYFLNWRDYEDLIYYNNTTSTTIPSHFSIQPGNPYVLYLDPPPSTASHTATVYYIKAPTKLTSSTPSGTYPIPDAYAGAIVKYAFWLYKYRDSDPNFGDAMYKHWDIQVRRYAANINKAIRPRNIVVNFRKRR